LNFRRLATAVTLATIALAARRAVSAASAFPDSVTLPRASVEVPSARSSFSRGGITTPLRIAPLDPATDVENVRPTTYVSTVLPNQDTRK
jgi:hypothetical protein